MNSNVSYDGLNATDSIATLIHEVRSHARPHTIDSDGSHVVALRKANGEQVAVSLLPFEKEYYRWVNKTGQFTVSEPGSFLAYISKHAEDNTEVWADLNRSSVTAVIDAHGTDETHPGLHRVSLSLLKTQDWQDWTQIDRTWVSQEDLATFIEDHYMNFMKPTALHMLDLAQTFEATKRVDYRSATRVKDGQVQLVYEEKNEQKGGGEFTIPDEINLRIQIFEGAEPVNVTARMQWRITTDKSLVMKLLLNRPRDLERAAFNDLTALIKSGVEALQESRGIHFYYGTAPSPEF